MEDNGRGWKEELPIISEDQVCDHLKNLKVFKSMGPDGIHPQVLRELADEVAKPLSILFPKSWQPGELPTDWKKGNITPIVKKGRKEEPGSSRPGSHTSVPSKIMEQILLEALLKQKNSRDVIGYNQHGFTKGKSCLTNLLASYEQVTTRIDEGRATDVIYLDLSKAFGTVKNLIWNVSTIM